MRTVQEIKKRMNDANSSVKDIFDCNVEEEYKIAKGVSKHIRVPK